MAEKCPAVGFEWGNKTHDKNGLRRTKLRAPRNGEDSMIVIGNMISFVAALFMMASCVMKSRRATFLCQFAECSLLAVASVFFGSFSGVTTLALSAVRNLVVAKDRYTKPVMYTFLTLTIVMGVLANTRGGIGLLPVIATVQYTICCHYVTGEKATKYSIFANIFVWVLYSFLICDFSTAISDSIVLLVDAAAIIRLRFRERAGCEQEAPLDGTPS